jgi:hypothetical protein
MCFEPIDATCGLGIFSLDIVHWLNKNKLIKSLLLGLLIMMLDSDKGVFL